MISTCFDFNALLCQCIIYNGSSTLLLIYFQKKKEHLHSLSKSIFSMGLKWLPFLYTDLKWRWMKMRAIFFFQMWPLKFSVTLVWAYGQLKMLLLLWLLEEKTQNGKFSWWFPFLEHWSFKPSCCLTYFTEVWYYFYWSLTWELPFNFF